MEEITFETVLNEMCQDFNLNLIDFTFFLLGAVFIFKKCAVSDFIKSRILINLKFIVYTFDTYS
jgi:hypothetical protein